MSGTRFSESGNVFPELNMCFTNRNQILKDHQENVDIIPSSYDEKLSFGTQRDFETSFIPNFRTF